MCLFEIAKFTNPSSRGGVGASASKANAGVSGLAVADGRRRGDVSAVLPAADIERKKSLLSFQKSISIKFKHIELLNMALTHSSVSNESPNCHNNERLEFLGDGVLGLVAAALLYERFAEKPEGELAKIKSVVVSEAVLSGIARKLRLDTMLLLGRGEESTGGRNKNAILADAFEALIGAVYLDCGYAQAFAFVSRYINEEIDNVVDKRRYQNYKSLLQEFCQHEFKTCPVYKLVKYSGPEHDRSFWVEVAVGARVFGPCIGKRKKAAEQEAAKIACEALIKDRGDRV
ncbi:MAG: ribonuclease III [Treponema sp.]|nr:ribonuclease III [Treponema sp.]